MKFLLDLRYRLEYVVLRLVIGIVRLFSVERATNLSARLWRTFGPLTRRHKRALANLALAFPEKTPEEREAIAMEMWDNLGRVAAETMLIDRVLAQASERFELETDFFIHRYKGKMGSIIIVGMHFANWEIAAWPLMLADANLAGVYRLVKNPYVDRYLYSKRGDLYPSGLLSKGRSVLQAAGFDTARVLSNHIRDGGRLGFLADRYDGRGIEVPFFGHHAKSTSFPAMLARRFGPRLWIGRCIRIGRATKFRCGYREIKVPRTEDAEADIRWITAAIQRQFEEWIREDPGQYMWINRRFS